MVSQDNREILKQLLVELSTSQLSTVIAALDEADSLIGTSRNRENYAFLAKLVEFGLAQEVPLDIDLPDGMVDLLTSIRISESAKPLIQSLLQNRNPEENAVPEKSDTPYTLYTTGDPNSWTVLLGIVTLMA